MKEGLYLDKISDIMIEVVFPQNGWIRDKYCWTHTKTNTAKTRSTLHIRVIVYCRYDFIGEI